MRCAHRRDVRRQLRRLRDHGAVDVADLPAGGRARGAPPRPAAPANRRRGTARRCPGKWWPMSPSAAAPSSASVIACSSASASEWPGRPCVCGDLDAAEDQLAARRPGHACPSLRRRARVGPRGFMRLRCAAQQHGLGQREVLRVGDLEVLDAARHQQRRQAHAPRSRSPRR